ncbi:hypothetical protein [Desulfonema ishimotonii]|uniref:hypothetical protein n=1 Tax=Desulfonema ishimotonii TaxID=45657 RepID=UPI0014081AA2|nr:hypothetical protein [Desulfonema ishimotonii]
MPLISRPAGINILPPSDALRKLLPTVKKQADAIILLSHANVAMPEIEDDVMAQIDVVITSGDGASETHDCDAEGSESQGTLHNTPVLKAESKGLSLGIATLDINKKAKPVLAENSSITLDQSVHGDENILRIAENKLEAYETEKKRREAEKLQKELQKGLKLSPEEFFKQYNQKTNSPKS